MLNWWNGRTKDRAKHYLPTNVNMRTTLFLRKRALLENCFHGLLRKLITNSAGAQYLVQEFGEE